MKTRNSFWTVCLLAILSAGSPLALAVTPAELQAELVGPWLVTVEDSQGVDKRTRTLRINGVQERSGGVFTLDAAFGWTDGQQTPIQAEISQATQERKLVFTTNTDTRVVASQGADGKFVGTFTLKNGTVRNATLAKASESELQSAKKSGLSPVSVIAKPAADVPKACATFFGSWKGTWSIGSYGEQWLRIVSVDAQCIVKFSYMGTDRVPRMYNTGQIKDGEFAFVCNSTTGGTCVFQAKGEDLWGRYSNSSGGTNGGIFKKID